MSRIETRDGHRSIQCIDPRTGDETAEIPCTPPDEVADRVKQARAAQRAWWELDLAARKRAIADLHQAFLRHSETLADLLASECGRPAGEAWTAEIVANHELFGWWLGQIDDLLTSTPIDLNPINYPRKRGMVRLEPRGVLGMITPWNLPVAIPLRTLVPALLAGNGIVWKPSEHTPRTAELLADLCAQTLPDGLVQLIQGDGVQGEALIGSGVDAIFFTGSVRTGQRVSAAAGARMIPVSLELGGKDAALVLPDADIERAAAGITWAAFGFAGQNCAAVERCFVHRDVFDAFLERVHARAEALRPGIDLGPLVTPAQLETVQRHVRDAVERGAQIRFGGEAPGPGLYHQPTVLTDVSTDMAIMREESFGPLLPLCPYDDLDDAIDEINASEFGLTTSVWTRDLDLGESLADRFECGVVTVNNHSFTGALPAATWGGVKGSGHGVTNSRFALYGMIQPRTVLVDAAKAPEMWWYPYNQALITMARGLVDIARKDRNGLRGIQSALTGVFNRWKETP